MAIDVKKIPFGLATFSIGELGSEQVFDGVAYHQADGGELTLTPVWEDIVVLDYGTTKYTKKLVGWELMVTIAAAQEDLDTLLLAMNSYVTPITDGVTSENIGFADSVLLTDARDAAVPVNIHPRSLPVADKSNDIYIFKMASTGEYTRAYNMSQGNVAIQLEGFIKDDADPTKIANYFYVGGVDPNSTP